MRRIQPCRKGGFFVRASVGRSSLLAAALVAGLAVSIGATAPAIAQDGTRVTAGQQVVLTGRVTVGQDETSGTVVIFDGPATIDGTVRGDVVAFNGRVDISGHVTRNIVAFNGPVTLGSTAEVDGDLVTRERPEIDPGATVRGDLQRVDSVDIGTGVGLLGRFVVWLAMTASLLVLGLLLLLFAPRAADAVALAARERTGAAVGWGIGLFLLLPIAAIVALVTIVGIPLGLGILLALGLIYSVGYVASAHLVGRLIVKPPSSRFGAYLVGWLILRVVALIPVLGGLTWLVAAVFGLGAIALAIRRANEGSRRAPAPPPPPPAPVGGDVGG
jgi:cytoskeletal protein CcmA (bactofilin family)